jgi:imidazolonepropionase-like amidohydrolase
VNHSHKYLLISILCAAVAAPVSAHQQPPENARQPQEKPQPAQEKPQQPQPAKPDPALPGEKPNQALPPATPPPARSAAQTAGVPPLVANAYESTYTPLPSKTTVIRNATILTAAGPAIERGSILLQNGKVAAVGQNVDAPSDAVAIDAMGKWVTPGIIDTHSHLGVYPAPGIEAVQDGNEMTGPNTAEVSAEHSLWPQDPQFGLALAGGVTAMQLLPGSANLFGGRGVTVKNVPTRTAEAMKFPGAPYGLKMACGENPKRVYGSRNTAPGTRMGNVAGYRRAWQSAAEYREKWRRWKAEGSDPAKRPERNLQLETLAGVLDGEILVHNHCYRADEMATMINVAREFGYKISSFHHAVEAYKVRDLLAANNICASMWADWWGFKLEAFDGITENIPLVHEAGACAIVHSDSEDGIQRLNQEAAKAIRAAANAGINVERADAIRWLTINPARALGIDKVTGSLEPGKNADVVIWSDDPFSVYSRAEQVFIDGAAVYDRNDPTRQPQRDFMTGMVQSTIDRRPSTTALPLTDVNPESTPESRRPTAPRATIENRQPAVKPQSSFRSRQSASQRPAGDARQSGLRGTVVRQAPADAESSSAIAITNARVLTVSGPALERATVLMRDGKIVAVGTNVTVPPGATVIEGNGKVVTPGWIDSATQIGIVEIPLSAAGTADESNTDTGLSAAFTVVDAFNPNSTVLAVTRVEGITRAVVTPAGTGHVLIGQGAVMELTGEHVPASVNKAPAAMFAVLGEAGAAVAGGSRSTAILRIREALQDARDFSNNRAAYNTAQRRQYARGRLDLEALLPVLRGEIPLAVQAHRASDLLAAMRLADDFKLRLVLMGASEAWMVAGEIARRDVPVVVKPLTNVPGFDKLGATLENAARLAKAGVTVALASFDTHNSRNLRQEAGNAIAYGLDRDTAIQAVTLIPARIWGVADRYGSLEPGKDADVVVWSGDPFELTTTAEHVFIHGREVPKDTRQHKLLEKYRSLR